MEEINVKVSKFGDRKFYLMYYDCPLSGRRKSRSAKTDNKREAEKLAAKWESQLREGRYTPAINISWEEFRRRYEAEVVPTLKPSTRRAISTAFNNLERLINPKKLRELTEGRLSYYQSAMRNSGDLVEPSIRSYLAHLKAALTWAVDVKLLPLPPKVKFAKRQRGVKMMKGRALAGEEFERMLNHIEAGLLLAAEEKRKVRVKRDRAKATKPQKPRSEAAKQADVERNKLFARAAAPGWRRLLIGLKLSGLRLGEALNLSWDDESKILIDLSGKRPMMRIYSEHEKGDQDRMHPITPDFAEMLWATRVEDRTGPVFPLVGRGDQREVGVERASTVIACIGRAAKVVVDKEKGKFASAHDLRRTFGEKWSKVVMPAVLQQLMRHEDITTTMRFYVGKNAEATADAVWEAASRINNSVNTSPLNEKSDESFSSQELAK